ncbi:MAG: nucleoside triphosphate pyrophosphohydrolase family protein [Alphaproteobacteria bacterium]|nr:nucleoside triphosphate pyrophosphohydrolase family protein [Alphaproteobacteria bacterium]
MEVKEYFENYTRFVDSVTSESSRNDTLYAERMKQLSKLLNGNYARLDHAVTGLAGESGEVADLWKKVKFMSLEYNDETKDKFIKELGDVCWYLFQTAYALNIPVNEIIDENIRKLQKRHPEGHFSPEYLQHKKAE